MWPGGAFLLSPLAGANGLPGRVRISGWVFVVINRFSGCVWASGCFFCDKQGNYVQNGRKKTNVGVVALLCPFQHCQLSVTQPFMLCVMCQVGYSYSRNNNICAIL